MPVLTQLFFHRLLFSHATEAEDCQHVSSLQLDLNLKPQGHMPDMLSIKLTGQAKNKGTISP